jgi:bifunctional DNA-binding transcriptional regulator/antitoxin component of YhaV-PrlF toxin-antitoxin module
MSRMTSKGQVTIPKRMRDQFDLTLGAIALISPASSSSRPMSIKPGVN